MDYKILFYKAGSEELISFLEKHKKEINKMFKKCFYKIYTFNMFPFFKHNNMFFLVKKDKILAVATIENIISKRFKGNIKTYELLSLKIKKNDKDLVKLYPGIGSLCRLKGKRYRGFGTKILNEISKYFKEKGFKYIYLTPESVIFKEITFHDCGIALNKKKYQESQKELINYYKSYGFNIYKHYYEFESCKDDNNIVLSNIFFPVMRKRL